MSDDIQMYELIEELKTEVRYLRNNIKIMEEDRKAYDKEFQYVVAERDELIEELGNALRGAC